VCGPSGTGKSHFCEALSHHAIDTGHTVAWFSIEDLGAVIRRHRVDDTTASCTAPTSSSPKANPSGSPTPPEARG